MYSFNFDMVRVIAIILITNSHFDALYPDPRLGTGGALGNSLFFLLSGYGLAHSFQHNKLQFGDWYLRRVSRIFPSVWIVACIAITWFGRWASVTSSDLVAEFLWPTSHWFVSAIVLFYIPFYFLLKSKRPEIFLWSIGVLVVPYLVGYFMYIDLSVWSIENGYFKWIFYGQLMLLGGWLASRADLIQGARLRRESFVLGILFIAYFAVKLGLSSFGLWHFQMAVHLLTIPILYVALRVFATEPMQKWILDSWSGSVVSMVSGMAYEIYLTQHLFHQNHWLQALPFPLGALMAIVGILILASVVVRLANSIRNCLSMTKSYFERSRVTK